MKKLLFCIGTRPEAIKLAPVIQAFQRAQDFRTRVVLTGQHREMVAQVMELFGLTADRDQVGVDVADLAQAPRRHRHRLGDLARARQLGRPCAPWGHWSRWWQCTAPRKRDSLMTKRRARPFWTCARALRRVTKRAALARPRLPS